MIEPTEKIEQVLEIADQLTVYVIDYYLQRGLKWPTVSEAIHWHDTEIGEALEIFLARNGGWVRNNPDGKPSWNPKDFAEELGDAILMLIIAGIVVGEDPILRMRMRMEQKLKEIGIGKPS